MKVVAYIVGGFVVYVVTAMYAMRYIFGPMLRRARYETNEYVRPSTQDTDEGQAKVRCLHPPT